MHTIGQLEVGPNQASHPTSSPLSLYIPRRSTFNA